MNSLVIKQKGESQNGGNKKAKHAKFSEKRTFLPPDTHTSDELTWRMQLKFFWQLLYNTIRKSRYGRNFASTVSIEGFIYVIRLLAGNSTKSNTPPWVFFTFLNCTNDTKSRNA